MAREESRVPFMLSLTRHTAGQSGQLRHCDLVSLLIFRKCLIHSVQLERIKRFWLSLSCKVYCFVNRKLNSLGKPGKPTDLTIWVIVPV